MPAVSTPIDTEPSLRQSAGVPGYLSKPLFPPHPPDTVLVDAKKIAAKHNIRLSADAPAQQIADQEHLTLHAEGLTLDGLLEIAIQGNGLQWKLEGRRILFYSNPGK